MDDSVKLLIGGELVDGEMTMDVINPATGEVVARCGRASPGQLDAAVAAAKAAFPTWAQTSIATRKAAVSRIADILESQSEPLARLLTLEQGKPLAEAAGEVAGAIAFLRYFAGLDLAPRIIEENARERIELHRRPLGVVGAILPWNFPLSLLAFKLGPALVAGNTVVVKPAATTPLSTLRVGALVRAALPPGVLNIIADANDLGERLTAHPDIRKISFTGSTGTGRKVLESASGTLKRVTLELGGNDPAIVLADADPETVAPLIFEHAFRNAGQVCLAIKRLYVHESIYDKMCEELARLADEAVVDDGLKQGTKIGPLQNRAQYDKVRRLIEKTRADGTLIAGGTFPEGPGYFVRPTIVRDIAEGTQLVDEEQFGPVLPVLRFTEEDDVVRRANASDYGLGASVWSSDVAAASAIAGRIEAGTVWVNRHLDLRPNVPFGGAKQSGMGVELAEEGLDEYTQTQVINVQLAAA